MQIRYWNETAKQVGMQFLKFRFPRCPNAKNLFDCLITLLKDLPSECFLQLSIDGPNTKIPTGVYLQCFTMIVVKRIIQKLLILALVAYMFSVSNALSSGFVQPIGFKMELMISKLFKYSQIL